MEKMEELLGDRRTHYEFPSLSVIDGLRHAFIGKGALPFSFSRSDMVLVSLLSRVLDAKGMGIVLAEQVHGDGVALVGGSAPDTVRLIEGVDALLTGTRGILLAVRSADCLPIFLVHLRRKAVGLVHAGREGTRKGITENAVRIMAESYRLDPADIVAAVGPSIGPCCFGLDLWRENERQLKSTGITRVFNCRICTACNLESFSSYRKEGAGTSLMLSFLGLVNKAC